MIIYLLFLLYLFILFVFFEVVSNLYEDEMTTLEMEIKLKNKSYQRQYHLIVGFVI